MTETANENLVSHIATKELIECYNQISRKHTTRVALKALMKMNLSIIKVMKSHKNSDNLLEWYFSNMVKILEDEGIDGMFIIKDKDFKPEKLEL